MLFFNNKFGLTLVQQLFFFSNTTILNKQKLMIDENIMKKSNSNENVSRFLKEVYNLSYIF